MKVWLSSPAVLARLTQLALRLAVWWAPGHPHAVVTGFPDDEGNSVELVRRLADRVPVYWLLSGERADAEWLLEDVAARSRVRLLPKDSLGAYLAYVTARFVFFTHGLYGSPPPPPHKVFVNLWHGDGPKLSKGFTYVRSTYAVAGTRLWGKQRPQYFGVREEDVLVTGHPRIDQFARPPAAATMRALGLDPDRPLVLWMPTYRETAFRGRRRGAVLNWADGQQLTRQEAVVAFSGELARVADQVGVTVAVKPHPLDREVYAQLGLPVVSNEDLRRARVTVYQLLGATQGIITDYSSVWTDYLALDRPVGFYCPDLEEYEAARGLNVPDYLAIVPGPRLVTRDDADRFLAECAGGPQVSQDQRARSAALVGAVTTLGATDRLLDAIGVPPPTRRAAVTWFPSQRRRALTGRPVTAGPAAQER